MKVLWFSNCDISRKKVTSTGTWLYTMSQSLVKQGCELYNITEGKVNNVYKTVTESGLTQYIIPKYSLINGLPSKNNIAQICHLVELISPDIIHIWGMESYYGLLASRSYIKGNIILEIQGIKSQCVPVFYGNLSPGDIIKCIGLREIIMPSLSLISKKQSFRRWSKYEKEMVQGIANISTQSDWVRSWVKNNCNPSCRLFNTSIIVRDAFLQSTKWALSDSQQFNIFTISAGSEAYKGVHIALYAIHELKKRYPNVLLKIAGSFGHNKVTYRKPGYTKYLLKLIKDLDIIENVVFLGPLTAEQIVEELHKSRCFIQTSFVESYSLALAEAMAVGVPCVVSYAGAMPELAVDNSSALYYPSYDSYSCADRIGRLFESEELCEELSSNSRLIAYNRNNEKNAVDNQISIYNDIVSKKKFI